MRTKHFIAAAALGLAVAGLAMPPAAAGDNTVLNYSIRDARAFLWQIHYPQSSFISEFYGPCNPDPSADHYGCDRGRYAKPDPATCGTKVVGRTAEAPETPKADAADGGAGPTDKAGAAADWPRGNPVSVIHGLSMGRLGSSPEAGGLASMYYVDNSGRRETEAHVESDAYVSNRNDYEERCALVDSALESTYINGPFAAHVLSRADQTPSTYSMNAFTTAGTGYGPGQSKESISIVKLWQADGRVHGILSSTVRAITLSDQIYVDAVRSVVSFSSDGTEKGLIAKAKTEASGITINGQKVAGLSLPADASNSPFLFSLGNNSYLGLATPVVQVDDKGHEIAIRAPGLFLAAETPLDQLPLPEDPIQDNKTLQPIRVSLCTALKQDPSRPPCRLTVGGRLFKEQVVYVAGALLDAGVGRIDAFSLPPLPPLPKLPPLPPFNVPTITPPGSIGTDVTVPGPAQPVGLPTFVTRELAGSPWPLVAIVTMSALGLISVVGRWSMRWPWARSVAHVPPFPAIGWAYRAFLKG